jgi:predicted nuclease of predicted toxin-antitoxin system
MNGFLFDEHLPANIQFTPSFPVIHVSVLGASPNDTQIWQYAKQNDLVIVTKDADFSDRLMVDSSPPKVVHLRFGNMRKRVFHAFLASVWPKIEALIVDHKLIDVYQDRIEAIK